MTRQPHGKSGRQEKLRHILAALRAPGRTEGVRKIAKRFGVDPGTVRRISRPFGLSEEAVTIFMFNSSGGRAR